MNINDKKIQFYFLSGLLIFATLLMLAILRPYFISLILAFIFAVIFQPVFTIIARRVRGRKLLASILTTLLIILILLVPFAIFGTLVFKEIAVLLASPDKVLVHFTNIHLPDFLQKANGDFKDYVQNLMSSFFNDVGGVFSNLAEFFVNIVLIFVSLIYLFKDGPNMLNSILNALPFTRKQSDKLINDLGAGIRAVIGGYLLVAIIEGIISGAGFWFFGLPNPALWGFVTVFAALVPTFGSALVNIPAILFLLSEKHTGAGIGLALWWLAAISIIDNYIGPRFISGRVRIHILLLIFGVIGGLKVFGTFGFIIGPLIIIFFWSVLEMFQQRDELEE